MKTLRSLASQRFILKSEIFLVIFGKIQSLCFWGDPLTGIIPKAPALILNRFHTLPGAKDLSVFQICSKQTVAAGTFYFFTKQHNDASGMLLSPLYRKCSGISIPILRFSQNHYKYRYHCSREQSMFQDKGAAEQKTVDRLQELSFQITDQ